MKEAKALAILQEIYRLESISFLRYLVKVSGPPVHDEADKKALALFQVLYLDVERNIRGLGNFLEEHGTASSETRWPLSYAGFNYLRPRYLLRPTVERVRNQVEQVEAQARALEAVDWRQARELAETVLRRDQTTLGRLSQAVEETPEQTAEPAQLKGTSASRW